MKKITFLLFILLFINTSLFSELINKKTSIIVNEFFGSISYTCSTLETISVNSESNTPHSDFGLCEAAFGTHNAKYTTPSYTISSTTYPNCIQDGGYASFLVVNNNDLYCSKSCSTTCSSNEFLDIYSCLCKPIPTCSTTEYLDKTNNICIPIPTCPTNEYFDKNIQMCTSIPSCPYSNEIFNTITQECECDNGFTKVGLDCVSDIDNDTIPDTIDDDIDGDGIPNNQDSTPMGNDYIADSVCYGQDSSTIEYFGDVYNINDYNYYGYLSRSACMLLIDTPSVTSSYVMNDISPTCETEYCFTYGLTIDCSIDYLLYKPSNFDRYKFIEGLENYQCDEAVTGYPYISNYYVIPNLLECPNKKFCFLELAPEAPDANQTIADTNSSLELLNESKINNAKLTDIDNKLKFSNESLTDISKNTLDLLAKNNEIKTILDTMKLNDVTTSGKIISEQKLINNKLDTTNYTLRNLNDSLATLNTNVRNNGFGTTIIADNTNAINNNIISGNNQLNNINTNLLNMTDLLNGDGNNNPFLDLNYSDGSESFSSFQNTFSDNLGVTYEVDLFGLSSIVSNSSFQPISVNIHGSEIDIISQSMINSIPIVEIRAMFLFMFAIAGFITVFRTV